LLQRQTSFASDTFQRQKASAGFALLQKNNRTEQQLAA
jgi:hypothetical protein